MLRLFRDYFIIKKSNYFDAIYYINEYPDCRYEDVDPLFHFIRHGWKEGRNPSNKFDTQYYLNRYPDVKNSKRNPLVHYIRFGFKEGRAINNSLESNSESVNDYYFNNLTRRIQGWLLRHGLRFYKAFPKIFQKYIQNFIYTHFYQQYLKIIHFHLTQKNTSFPITNINCDYLKDFDLVNPTKKIQGSIAIHLHIYYEDLIEDLFNYLSNMPYPFDLFISVTSAETKFICQNKFSNLSLCNRIDIQIVPNRGRDIAPFICVFGSELKNYEYIAHFHTKKSLYNENATLGWRDYLFNTLLGSKEKIKKIFTFLKKDTQYGIVYPQNFYLLPYMANTWLANQCLASKWLPKLGIQIFPKGYFNFPAGSMFWAKSKALSTLFNSNITINDFPKENGQNDGTLAHTIERLFVLICQQNGFLPVIIKDSNFKSWSPWRFDQYLTRNRSLFQNIIYSNKIKVIGFDIFDTLLTRPLLEPGSIKKIIALRVEKKIGQSYQSFRETAETLARETKGMDVDIDEIFLKFQELSGLPKQITDELKNLEIQIEEKLLMPRKEGTELFNLAKVTKKPIVIITDMFLSKAIIEKILIKNNIAGWDLLLVSSDIGLRKDNKQLFEYMLNHYSITPDQFLMVGDNERSDIQIPSDMGSSIFHILKSVDLASGLPRFSKIIDKFKYSTDINVELTLGLIIQKNFSNVYFDNPFDINSLIEVTPYNYGYSLIGPLLISFSSWLVDQTKSNGIKRLFFLSREGKIMKEIFQQWINGIEEEIKPYYIEISRRCAGVASIKNFDDILKIAQITYFPNTLENFLITRFGLEFNEKRWKRILQKLDWLPTKEIFVYDKKIEHLIPFLKLIEDDIYNRSNYELTGLKTYLQNFPIFEDDNQALVDVGYGGSIQGYLNQIVEKKFHGYYLMTDNRSHEVSNNFNVFIKGCFYENINQNGELPVLYKDIFDLEKLLGSIDPQVEYYETNKLGEIIPNYRLLTPSEINANSIREEIIKGAIDFSSDAVKLRDNIFPSFKPSTLVAKSIIETLFLNKSQKEINFLSKIVLDDYYSGRGLVN